jgi:hypothetical protein
MKTSESCSILIALLFSLIISYSSNAMADNADNEAIGKIDNEIWGSVGADFLNYKEYVPPPDLPDSEHGWMPSGAIGISALLNHARGPANNLYLALEGSGTFGTTHYNGAYFYYPTVPLQGTTNDTVWTADAKIGKGFPFTSNAMVIPYAELGYRYWDRNSGPGSSEDYRNFNALGGLMLQVALSNNLVLTGHGAGGTTFAPQMTTDGDTYNLGAAPMYEVGGKISYVVSRVELFTALDYDHFTYVQSPVLADDTYEPTNHTNDTILRVGVGYSFE